MKVDLEKFDKMMRLSSQLYSATIVCSTDVLNIFNRDIRENFLCIVSDLSRELRETIRKIDDGQGEA